MPRFNRRDEERAALAVALSRARTDLVQTEIAIDLERARRNFGRLFSHSAAHVKHARKVFHEIGGKYGVAVDVEAGTLAGFPLGTRRQAPPPAPAPVRRSLAEIEADLVAAEAEEVAAKERLRAALQKVKDRLNNRPV